MPDFNFLLTTRLSPDQQAALQVLPRVSHAAGLNCYLTGGPMRDLLTGQPVRFLQFTTEGDPAPLVAALKAAGAERISSQAESRSVRLHLHGVRVRIAAARGEAGAGTIMEDLRRRGLTINSLGLSLNPASRYLLLDPTNGISDIEARLIRVNHPYVFIEDPIVLLRAVRLSTRLGFAIEERTSTRLEAAQEGEYLSRATTAAKGQEWEAIAYEPDPAAVVRALDKGGWLAAAFGAGVRAAKMNLGALEQIGAAIEGWEALGMSVDAGLASLPLLFGGLSSADATRLANALPSRHLAHGWKAVRPEAVALEKKILAVPGGVGSALRIQELAEKASGEAVVLAALDPAQAKAGRRLREFLAEATQLRARLPLAMLRGLGIPPQSDEGRRWWTPWYRRLLAGEPLTDAEITEKLRVAVMATRPALPEAAPVRSGRGRGRLPQALRFAAKPATPPAPLAAAAPVAPPAPAPPPAKAKPAVTVPPAKPAPKPVSKPASKAAAKTASRPAKPARTHAPSRRAKPQPKKSAPRKKSAAPGRKPRRG